MLIARTMAASLGWRAFAVLVTVGAGPVLISSLEVAGSNIARNSAFGIVALVGLLGYAYGFRIGPMIFWRFFAVIFVVGLMMRAGSDMGPIAVAVARGTMAAGSSKAIAAGIMLGAFLLMSIALLRHAQLVRPAAPKNDRQNELTDIFA